MQCPICKQELEIKNRKVGETENGEAIFNEFAICHDCKKQWNLDKQRAKKQSPAAEEAPKPKKKRPRPETANNSANADTPKPRKKKRPVQNSETTANSETTEKPDTARPVQRPDAGEVRPRPKKRRPEGVAKATLSETAEEVAPRPKKKKRPVSSSNVSEGQPRPKKRSIPSNVKPAPRAMDEPIEEFSDALGKPSEDRPKVKKRRAIDNTKKEQTYSNIPPKHVRESREKEMRENYQNMLDEDDADEGSGFPTVLVVILILLILAAAAFAGYWFLLR